LEAQKFFSANAVVASKVKKRLLIWVFFGLILTLLPIIGASIMSLPHHPDVVDFFELACNQDLLAVAFTLSAAAAADVIFSRSRPDEDILKLVLGSIGLLMAFISAFSFVIIRAWSSPGFPATGDPFQPFSVAVGIAALYIGSMVVSALCEALSEV
jgi:hypothetical protein